MQKIHISQKAHIRQKTQSGFTLVELMVALTIIGILLFFAVPSYQSYIATADEGVVVNNLNSMAVFQEDFFLRTGGYAVDLDDIAEIQAAIGWNPRANDGITYSVAAGDGTTYSVTAVHPDGLTVCIRYPDNVRC